MGDPSRGALRLGWCFGNHWTETPHESGNSWSPQIRCSDGTVSLSRGNGCTLVVKRGVRPSRRKPRSWSCAWPPLGREPSTLLVAQAQPLTELRLQNTVLLLQSVACGPCVNSPRLSRSPFRTRTRFASATMSRPARSETKKICGETNVLIASIVAEVTYGCGR